MMIEAILLAMLWFAILLAMLYLVHLVAQWIVGSFNLPILVLKVVDVILGLIALYWLVVNILLPLVHGMPGLRVH